MTALAPSSPPCPHHESPPAPDFSRAPAVTRLTLTRFRGYAAARIEPPPGVVVLTAPNGAGKTNLLEALSFLAPGRGLRRARLSDIDRRAADEVAGDNVAGGGPWAVAAQLDTAGGVVEIGTGRDGSSRDGGNPPGDAASERRLLRIDGSSQRGQTALGQLLAVIWLVPSMDRLFADSASGRRRFLDRLVLGLDPGHARRVSAYETALKERSRLLRDGPADPHWLAALESRMAEEGVALTAARAELVAALDRAATGGFGPFPGARLALDGLLEGWLSTMPALAAEERFRRALAENRARDQATGSSSTIAGPHRSDLSVHHAPKNMPAAHCSTGEQKALLIGILLAAADLLSHARGEPPMLLLDEVAAHLDAERREALFNELASRGGQAWLTGTDPQTFASLAGAATFFSVADATIRPVPALEWIS